MGSPNWLAARSTSEARPWATRAEELVAGVDQLVAGEGIGERTLLLRLAEGRRQHQRGRGQCDEGGKNEVDHAIEHEGTPEGLSSTAAIYAVLTMHDARFGASGLPEGVLKLGVHGGDDAAKA